MNPYAPPMVPVPGATWVLLIIAGLLVLASLVRRRRRPPAPKYHYVSWRVLWWRKYAPPEAVRHELAPLEIHLHDVARLNSLFPDHDDAEEGDHAVL